MANIQVEEFVPRRDTQQMLAITERVLALDNEMAAEAAENLQRSLVWMEKYLAPTTEFWDWPSQRHQIDVDKHINVSFIGLGWLVGLERAVSDGPQHLASVEHDLNMTLLQLTKGLAFEAQLRLNVRAWTPKGISKLARAMEGSGRVVTMRGSTLAFSHNDVHFEIDFDSETMTTNSLDRNAEVEIRDVLSRIRAFGNREFRGADWCAYKRRRLTIVQYDTAEAQAYGDLHLQIDPRGLFARNTTPTTSTLFLPGVAPDGSQRELPGWKVGFPQAPFHLGIIQPRLFLQRLDLENGSSLALSDKEVRTYLSYCWISHYTRLWEYLIFEDLYTYIDDIRHLQRGADITIGAYHQKYQELSDLRAELEFLERLDSGGVNSYKPPVGSVRSEYENTPKTAGESGVVEWLRSWLIPSTITTLTHDPLLGAVVILDVEERRISTAFSTASQIASLRLQRTLQALQFVFIVAATAQLLALIPLGNALDSVIGRTMLGPHLDSVETWLGWTDVDFSATVVNTLVLILIVWLFVVVAQARMVRWFGDYRKE